METYYPYTLLSFANQKKKKKCEIEVLVNENYKYINLQIIPFLRMWRQLKHHQLRISEIFILLETILNALNV